MCVFAMRLLSAIYNMRCLKIKYLTNGYRDGNGKLKAFYLATSNKNENIMKGTSKQIGFQN